MGAMIKQTMTEGGTLYGYAAEELQPHLNACHGGATVWLRTEAEHMVVHALGCDHEHYHTDTGALALAVTEPPTGLHTVAQPSTLRCVEHIMIQEGHNDG